MYDRQQPQVLNYFSFYDVYFTFFYDKLKGFFTYLKTVAIHRIMESEKIRWYSE